MKVANKTIRTLTLALTAVVLNLSVIEPVVAGSFANTGAMSSARRSHTATLLLNGIGLVADGYDGTNFLSNMKDHLARVAAALIAATLLSATTLGKEQTVSRLV